MKNSKQQPDVSLSLTFPSIIKAPIAFSLYISSPIYLSSTSESWNIAKSLLVIYSNRCICLKYQAGHFFSWIINNFYACLISRALLYFLARSSNSCFEQHEVSALIWDSYPSVVRKQCNSSSIRATLSYSLYMTINYLIPFYMHCQSIVYSFIFLYFKHI